MICAICIKKSVSCLRWSHGKHFILQIMSAIALTVLMFGCATTYKVKPDLIKNFQEPKVPADKTGIYIIRGSNFVGGGRGVWVAVNESVVADLSNSSHVYLEFDSGLNSVSFIQATAGFGYLAVDNKPGELLYARLDYTNKIPVNVIAKGLGQTMVMETDQVLPLDEKRKNDAYDNLLINPGLLNYPIMVDSDGPLSPDEGHALVRFYRPGSLIAKWAFDIWNQDGYLGSTKGGKYFTVKLKPGRHVFISLSEHYAVLEAELEAKKEYAVEVDVGMGWNQAHIKLLPIDLSTDEGGRQAKKWMDNLTSTMVNKEVVESDAIAQRIAMGINYLSKVQKAVAKNEIAKRSLPAAFGK